MKTISSISAKTTAAPRELSSHPGSAHASTLKKLGIASLASQILIVVTGGAVRLTKSGLGCDSWPNCTPDHLFPVPESGIHAFIEFGNRLMTFVLIAIAVLTIRSAYKNDRRDVIAISWWLLLGVPGQGIIGLVTVYTKLNPWIVGLHFILSMTLVSLSTVQLNRISGVGGNKRQPRYLVASQLFQLHLPWRIMGSIIFCCSSLSIIIGIIVTGSGPHAGDAEAIRNGLDPALWTRIHTIPVYILVMATLILLAIILYHLRSAPETLKAATQSYILLPVILLAFTELLQAALGYCQHFLGLPVLLVGLHLCGAPLLAAACMNVVHRLFVYTTIPYVPTT